MQKPEFDALLYSPETGFTVKFSTNQPGLQLYSGNWLLHPLEPRVGLCLDFQDVPNAPNMAGFPSTVLNAGATYHREITLSFERNHC